jgi:hypothetical protein
MLFPVRGGFILVVLGALGCVHVHTVQIDALSPRYVSATPARRVILPLVLVYDPKEFPEEVPLAVPGGFPGQPTVRGARSLVTRHLPAALKTIFEHVEVVDSPARIPGGALVGTVRFVEVGLVMAAGGHTAVGTLEWSLSLRGPGEERVIYSWAEKTVGTREGAGAWGRLDPSPMVQGAIEDSLRGLLKDLDSRGVAQQLNGG